MGLPMIHCQNLTLWKRGKFRPPGILYKEAQISASSEHTAPVSNTVTYKIINYIFAGALDKI